MPRESPVRVVAHARAQAGPLVERLEALGLDVVECPLIEIEPLEEPVRSTRAGTTGWS